MKHTGTILLHIIISLLLCLPYTGYSQCQAAKEIEACSTFDDWTVREIKESGIIDPTLVLKNAITNAVGIVSNLLMTECITYHE